MTHQWWRSMSPWWHDHIVVDPTSLTTWNQHSISTWRMTQGCDKGVRAAKRTVSAWHHSLSTHLATPVNSDLWMVLVLLMLRTSSTQFRKKMPFTAIWRRNEWSYRVLVAMGILWKTVYRRQKIHHRTLILWMRVTPWMSLINRASSSSFWQYPVPTILSTKNRPKKYCFVILKIYISTQ